MDKEYIGYTLAIVGIALIAIGALNVAGYLSFQTVDYTAPQILYSYPQDKMIYKATEIDEYVLYAQDQESPVQSATYADKYSGVVSLVVTPYTQLTHKLTVVQSDGTVCKYPDVNFDGKVDGTDQNLVLSAFNKNSTSPDWSLYEKYDLNNDGAVNIRDTAIVSLYLGTVTFSLKSTASYTLGENITFAFSASSVGGTSGIQGVFLIQDYQFLSGLWTINGQIVNASSAINLESYSAIVSFQCTDATVSSSQVTVIAGVNGKSYVLPLTGTNTWNKELTFSSGINSLILEASTSDKINKITVSVITPNQPTITLGHIIIIAGAVLTAAGVVVVKKEKETSW